MLAIFSVSQSAKRRPDHGTSYTISSPCITVHVEELEVVYQFQYLGSTTTDTLSLVFVLNKHISKATNML